MLLPTRRALALTAVACTAFAPSALAQTSLTAGLTTACQNAVVSLIASSFGTCASLNSLVAVVTTSGSIVTPINTWLGNLCSQTCNSSAISSAKSTLSSGCSTDISNNVEAAVLLQEAINNYSTLRSAACYQSTSNSTLCVSQLLTDVQSATGTSLTLTDALSLTSNYTSLENLPASEVCSDCNKALYTKLAPLLSSASSSDGSSFQSAASSKCGASFVDGSIPSTVSTSSGNVTSSSGGTGTGADSTTSTALNSAKGLRLTAKELVVAGAGLLLGTIALV